MTRLKRTSILRSAHCSYTTKRACKCPSAIRRYIHEIASFVCISRRKLTMSIDHSFSLTRVNSMIRVSFSSFFQIYFFSDAPAPLDVQVLRDSLVCPLNTVDYELIKEPDDDDQQDSATLAPHKRQNGRTEKPFAQCSCAFEFFICSDFHVSCSTSKGIYF
jgi:hypothetical protein